MKASNSEPCESARFQRLAHTDLCEHLKKKKMKAFIPQMTQIIYFGALFIFCVGSLVVSSGSFDGCSMVSFVTSLVFLVEPIQVVLCADNIFFPSPFFSCLFHGSVLFKVFKTVMNFHKFHYILLVTLACSIYKKKEKVVQRSLASLFSVSSLSLSGGKIAQSHFAIYSFIIMLQPLRS